MTEYEYGLWSAGAIAAWLAVYRLPFGDAARRRRVALWLADRTGGHPDAAFAVFATVLYLGLGVAVLISLLTLAGLTPADLVGSPRASAVLYLLLALCGTSSLNILSVSVLYRLRPSVDVPGEIAAIRWISSILSLPRQFRWIIPALAAVVEELVFRGAVFLGLGSTGAGFAVACAISTTLFVVGQVVLVSTPVQGYVMGASSLTLGVIGCLLTSATGGILPAVVLHASFAGFYTTMGVASGRTRTAASLRGARL
jgi:hypothetical protein